VIIARHDPRERVAAHHRAGVGIARIGYPIGIRRATVAAREYITPKMLRLTIEGPDLEGFHSYQADDHIKIVFAERDGTRRDPVPNGEQSLDWPHPSPPNRKYTVRRYDPATLQMDLDFVLHHGGLASEWAGAVGIGEPVTIAGPAGAKAFPHTYAHYVFAVDATALPAAARWLEESPQDVSCDLVIETVDPVEHSYPLPTRDRVRVHRIVRPPDRSLLMETVDGLTVPDRTFLFAAGEAGDIKPLRSWRKAEVDSLITGYWKRGVAGLDE